MLEGSYMSLRMCGGGASLTAPLPLAAVVIVAGVVLGGCASFQPKPIMPREVLRDLQRLRLRGDRARMG